jgi:hypothetical protein
MNNGVKSVELYIVDMESSTTYSFDEYFPEDIIKKIKRYYSSGVLYENVNLLESAKSNNKRN